MKALNDCEKLQLHPRNYLGTRVRFFPSEKEPSEINMTIYAIGTNIKAILGRGCKVCILISFL